MKKGYPAIFVFGIALSAFLAGVHMRGNPLWSLGAGLCCVVLMVLCFLLHRRTGSSYGCDENTFSEIVSLLGNGYYRADKAGRIVFSGGLTRLVGTMGSSMERNDHVIVNHLSDLIVNNDVVKEFQGEIGPVYFESELETESGAWIKFAHSVVVLRDSRDRITGYCGVVVNLSDLINFENELIQERGFLESVMNNSAESVFIQDFSGKFLRVNKIFARYAGVSHPDACIGMSVHNFLTPQTADKVLDEITNVAATGQTRHLRMPATDSKGNVLHFDVCHALHRNQDGDPAAIVGYARELQEDHPRDAAQISSYPEGLSSLAHELRTPVAGMVGCLKVLESAELSPLALEYVSKGMQSAQRLKKLVNSFLNEYSEGQPELSPENQVSEQSNPDEHRNARALRVLLAEDDISSQVFMRKILENWGFDVRTAVNGSEVLECLAEQKCDLALMDIQMPEMNGYEAISRIRKNESQEERMPIIVISAYCAEADFKTMKELGVSEFLSKPVRTETLKAAVYRVFGERFIA